MTDTETITIFRELGVSPTDFVRIRNSRTYQDAASCLEALKSSAKRGYREAARRLHPDRTCGDSDKEELFKRVTEVYRQIQDLSLRDPVLRRRTRVRVSYNTTSTVIDGVRVRIRVGDER